MTQQTMTKAAFARLCDVSKPAVAKWLSTGIAVLAENHEIHLAATAESMRRYRSAGLPSGFAALLDGCAPAAITPKTAPKQLRATRVTEHRRGDLAAHLLELDWKMPFEATEAQVRDRLDAAAEAVGLEVVESTRNDDGHWGGFQLRNISLMERHGGLCFDAIVAGYGFELEEFEVLVACREKLTHPDDHPEDDDDLIELDLELLPALAYPFGPRHQPPAADGSLQ
jgi:hypothetical protein